VHCIYKIEQYLLKKLKGFNGVKHFFATILTKLGTQIREFSTLSHYHSWANRSNYQLVLKTLSLIQLGVDSVQSGDFHHLQTLKHSFCNFLENYEIYIHIHSHVLHFYVCFQSCATSNSFTMFCYSSIKHSVCLKSFCLLNICMSCLGLLRGFDSEGKLWWKLKHYVKSKENRNDKCPKMV
jgi:hypothetical protein